MGKKGSWISALKKAFLPSSKDKAHGGTDRYEEKKWSLTRKRYGEKNSFIPLYREPSSIEKILRDVEKEQQPKAYQVQPEASQVPFKMVQQQKSPSIRENASNDASINVTSDKPAAFPLTGKKTAASDKAKFIISTKQELPRKSKSISKNYANASAIKIQAAFKGYMARKSYRTLKGLVRLQKMMKGQSVKRQTTNAIRSMQLLVRIQTQIHALRLQMVENRQQQTSWSNKEIFSNLSKWKTANQMEQEAHGLWDDSILTKEEKDASIRRKVEAIIKRERALAYAHSHQLLTVTPKTAHAALTDTRSGGFPWWNWLERQIHSGPNHPKAPTPPTPRTSTTTLTANAKFPHPGTHSKPAKISFIPSTPRSDKEIESHRSSNRWQEIQAMPTLRDTDSLTSCPAFTASHLTNSTSATAVRNYMATTVSAKAKIRPAASDCGRVGKEGRRRFSFPLSQTIGSLSLFSANQKPDPPLAPSTATGGMHRSMRSVGELSVDSTISIPAGLQRRHFR